MERIGAICRECGHLLHAPARLKGSDYPCPVCGSPITVPEEESEETAREVEIHELLRREGRECCPTCDGTLEPGLFEAIAHGGQGGATAALRWKPEDRETRGQFGTGQAVGGGNPRLEGSRCARCRVLYLKY